jgi:hypothetical protein
MSDTLERPDGFSPRANVDENGVSYGWKRTGNVPHVIIGDTEGDTADIIPTNGNFGIVAIAPGHVSTSNSTTETLDPDEAFTGDWEDITNFGVIVISIKANVASATNGLMVQFSCDGTDGCIISDDTFTIPADTGKTFSFQAAAQYFKVTYTNGGTIQTDFDLQTVLKPYYVKPSSHRIQDPIIDDDDAELTKAVLTGQSSVNSIFENVSTYREALDVNSAWRHRKIVNETFHQDTATSTTLNTAANEGDTALIVEDTTGFVVGDEIQISENGTQEIGLMTVTVVAAGTPGTLTLDRPIGNDYTTSAVVLKVTSEMAVVGSLASPQAFEVEAPAGNVWQITRILISMGHLTAADDGKFGGIAALTNGVAIRATTAAGRTVTFANWKTNGDMKLDMYDVIYSAKAPAGENGTNGRWTFTKSEVVAELNGDATPLQKMEVLIQDDLTAGTGITSFRIRAQGRVFKPI